MKIRYLWRVSNGRFIKLQTAAHRQDGGGSDGKKSSP